VNTLKDLRVRPMSPRDLRDVFAVERTKRGRLWDPPPNDTKAGGWVAEIDGGGVGYLAFRWDHEGTVLPTMAVAPYWRRRGVARMLLEKLHDKKPGSVRAIVHESDRATQLLLEDAGFQAVEVLPGRFAGEDGYVMDRRPGCKEARPAA
jgi:ribosomal protein S18 acetylase RimI-like enzyme